MPGLRDSLRLSLDEVTARLDPSALSFQTTDDLHPIEAVFGQERAVRAIEFALGMRARGYNLYASGPDGIGKSTIVESFLRHRAASMPAPPDWVYVHNFEDPDRPIGISLPAGRGRAFAEAVEQAVEAAQRDLQAAFESESYARQRQEMGSGIEEERAKLLEELQEEARRLGFALQMTQSGVQSAPLIEGEPASEEQFNALPEEERERIQANGRELERLVQETVFKMRAIERSASDRLTRLDEQVAQFAINHLFDPLIDEYRDVPDAAAFLEAARADIQKERERFRGQRQQSPMPGLIPPQAQQPPTRRYEVNVVIHNRPNGGAPVVRERHPTYYNLIGRIEYQGQMGAMVTDHTMIRPGSLAQANGGYILLRLRDLLMYGPSLEALKRALGTGELSIENLGEAFGLVPTSGLRPEPIPLDVKVVIVGEAALYSLLYRLDPDFRELFRVKADFETEFDRTKDNIAGLAAYITQHCERGGLRCFTAGAVARLIEQSSREVEDQRKLSAGMGELLDLLQQADYWAGVEGTAEVHERHVEQALEERVYRSSLIRDRIQEAIEDGTVYVDTAGSRVGQINALSIYDLGDIQFGRPSRVTCVASAGRGTIVMVERESDMAGRIHNKGFLILRGFLAHRFGMNRASSVHASLTFEQLYGDIDGDSASSTELYALLSALSERPIDQRVAVTGSVDQLGRVQPIGGATAKIEGFYEVCRQRGLDGRQGVIVPRANAHNVCLRPDVAQAVADGQFHVWAVDTIEEGVELLMDTPAGERGADGRFPEGTVYRLVEDRLDAFRQEMQQRPAQGDGLYPQYIRPQQVPPPPPPGVPPQPPPDPPVIV